MRWLPRNPAALSATKVADQGPAPLKTGNAIANFAALGRVGSGSPDQPPAPNRRPVLPFRGHSARTLRSLILHRRLPRDICRASQAAPAGEVAERDPGRT